MNSHESEPTGNQPEDLHVLGYDYLKQEKLYDEYVERLFLLPPWLGHGYERKAEYFRIQSVIVAAQNKMQQLQQQGGFIVGGTDGSKKLGSFTEYDETQIVQDIGNGMPVEGEKVVAISSQISVKKEGEEEIVHPAVYAKPHKQLHDRKYDERIIFTPIDELIIEANNNIITTPKLKKERSRKKVPTIREEAFAYRQQENNFANAISSALVTKSDIEIKEDEYDYYYTLLGVSYSQRQMERIQERNKFIIGGKKKTESIGTFSETEPNMHIEDSGLGMPEEDDLVVVAQSKISVDDHGTEREILPAVYSKLAYQIDENGNEFVIIYEDSDDDEYLDE